MAPQIPFTQLHELEVRNAFELLVGRNLITKDECRAIQAQLEGDLESQRLARVPLDLDGAFTRASDLSRSNTARYLTRSLDLLHVAAAQAIMCATFVSADDRQLAAAKATGFKVVDIKHPARREKS
jgi:predicted nucleic acid-binding protein